MSTSKKTRVLVAAAVALFTAAVGCSLAPGHCLYMSDCTSGTVCVEGLCEANVSVDPSSGDGQAQPSAEASVADTSVVSDSSPAADASDASTDGSDADAATDADATDTSTDGSVTDAPTDG